MNKKRLFAFCILVLILIISVVFLIIGKSNLVGFVTSSGCVDTDGGKSYYKFGKISSNNNQHCFEDECIFRGELIPTCKGNNCFLKEYY